MCRFASGRGACGSIVSPRQASARLAFDERGRRRSRRKRRRGDERARAWALRAAGAYGSAPRRDRRVRSEWFGHRIGRVGVERNGTRASLRDARWIARNNAPRLRNEPRFVVTSFSGLDTSVRHSAVRAPKSRAPLLRNAPPRVREIAARRARSPACLRDEALASGAPGGRARRRRVGRGVVQVERWGRPAAHGIGGRVCAIVARHWRRTGGGPRVPGCVRGDGRVALFRTGVPCGAIERVAPATRDERTDAVVDAVRLRGIITARPTAGAHRIPSSLSHRERRVVARR